MKRKLVKIATPANYKAFAVKNYGHAGTWLMATDKGQGLNSWQVKIPDGAPDIIGIEPGIVTLEY